MPIPVTALTQSLILFALSAACVWITGTRLAYLADALADRYKLGKTLVGLLLLSLAASLPEIATTLTAAFQEQNELVLVFPADILFRAGLILQDTSRTISLSLSIGLAVTAIYLTGLFVRRKPRLWALGGGFSPSNAHILRRSVPIFWSGNQPDGAIEQYQTAQRRPRVVFG